MMNFLEYTKEVNECIEKTTEHMATMEYLQGIEEQKKIINLAVQVKVTTNEEFEAIIKIMDNASVIAKRLLLHYFETELAMIEMKNQPIQ